MAGKRKQKRDTRGPLQRMHDQHVVEEGRSPELNDFAKQHGDYDRSLRTYVNRSVTPVSKWRRDGLVSDSQQAAIDHCNRLWEIISCSGSMVANLDRTVFGSPGDGHMKEVEARDDLHRMKHHVGEKYWNVWENVVRFDEPAGVAGSRLESTARNREVAARNCVLFVADIIAMRERLSY
jgi:hypothetical protein